MRMRTQSERPQLMRDEVENTSFNFVCPQIQLSASIPKHTHSNMNVSIAMTKRTDELLKNVGNGIDTSTCTHTQNDHPHSSEHLYIHTVHEIRVHLAQTHDQTHTQNYEGNVHELL